LVANYPTIKNLINRTYIEMDSTISIPIYKGLKSNQDEVSILDALLESENKDTLFAIVHFRAKFGVDVDSHFFKINRDGDNLEILLPPSHVLSYAYDNHSLLRTKNDMEDIALYHIVDEQLLIQLEKIKYKKNEAKKLITEALMFYFIPYKFNIKMYFDNQEFPLPQVPGLNKDVKEYIEEQVGKK
jgi:hypothetical protein